MTKIEKSDVLLALRLRVGARRGIDAERLAIDIRGSVAETKRSDLRRIRKCVEELRLEGEPICAHPRHGYFIAETAEELEATRAFLYARAKKSLDQCAAMGKVALPDLRKQLRLELESGTTA